MRSGPIQPNAISFHDLGIDIIAGRGRDPFSVMRMTVPPEKGVFSHQSADEDKLFVVLSGALRFHVGDEFFDVVAGHEIAVAKGETHGFVNVATTPAVHLIITSPARHDELLTALSKLPDSPPPEAMAAICRTYNQKVIGELRR